MLLNKRSYKSKQGTDLTELSVLALDTHEFYALTIETALYDSIGSPLPDCELAFDMETETGKGPFARPTIKSLKPAGKVEFKVKA